MVGVAISPDGRRGVTGSTDGVARVWTLSDAAALARDLSAVGRWDEALDAYERAMKAEPEDNLLTNEHGGSPGGWAAGPRWSSITRNTSATTLRTCSGTQPGSGPADGR